MTRDDPRWGVGREPGGRDSPGSDGLLEGVAAALEIERTDAAREREREQERRLERGRNRKRRKRGRPRMWERGPSAYRARAALRDLGAFRVVALKDIIQERFDGNRFAARAVINSLKDSGLVVEEIASGPRGGDFRVLSLTERGLAQVRQSDSGESGQRWWHGSGPARQEAHDAAVFRAAMAAARKLRDEGKRVRRVVIDAEFKSLAARRTEAARARGGDEAARAERERMAEDLGLPFVRGAVQFPDARVEWEDGRGGAGRVDIEVATAQYRARAVAAKMAAGFQVVSADVGRPRRGARGSRPAGGRDSGGGGGRFRRAEDWFEF